MKLVKFDFITRSIVFDLRFARGIVKFGEFLLYPFPSLVHKSAMREHFAKMRCDSSKKREEIAEIV